MDTFGGDGASIRRKDHTKVWEHFGKCVKIGVSLDTTDRTKAAVRQVGRRADLCVGVR